MVAENGKLLLLLTLAIVAGCQSNRTYENLDISKLAAVQKEQAISYLADVTQRYARDIYDDKVCTFTLDKMKLYGASLPYSEVRVDNYFAGENGNYISSYGINGKGDCTIARSEGAPLPAELVRQIYTALKSLGVQNIRVQVPPE
jgi:hypothetical protein